jgi:hypothetical protein
MLDFEFWILNEEEDVSGQKSLVSGEDKKKLLLHFP